MCLRCPLTANGDGGMENGSIYGSRRTFRNDPEVSFAQYGYTEYLELQYDQSVYGKSNIVNLTLNFNHLFFHLSNRSFLSSF